MQTQSQAPVKTATDDGTVHVSMKQLVKGVDIVFGGVVEILRSLEPQMAKQLVETMLDKEEHADAEEPNEPVAGADPVSADAPAADADGADGPADVTPDEQSVDTAASTVTVDDITKVIVAKIKQKRSNNEVIAKLLKTYKVEKVSELKPSQYEAFLTDISQI